MRALLSMTLLLLLSASLCAQEAVTAKLQGSVAAIAAAHHGKVALYAENLRTHEVVALDPDRVVQTASVIKLGILFTAMEQVRAGRLTLAQPVTLTHAEQVGGSGVLPLLDTPLRLTLHDVLMLMITQSDNTATNLAIDTVGRAAVDDELVAMGLHNTWLYKKIFTSPTEPMPADQAVYGLGKTTPREMAALLARMDRCEFVRPRPASSTAPADLILCTDMLTLLRHQFYRDGIPRLLDLGDSAQADAAIGNKTGALDAVRNDVGIVSTKAGLVVLSLFTYANEDRSWSTDTEAQHTLGRLAQTIVKAWSPAGLEPAEYRPHPVKAQ